MDSSPQALDFIGPQNVRQRHWPWPATLIVYWFDSEGETERVLAGFEGKGPSGGGGKLRGRDVSIFWREEGGWCRESGVVEVSYLGHLK